MDFGKILDQWDEMYGAEDFATSAEKEDDSSTMVRERGTNRKKLRKMKPQAELDLHGLTTEQAKAGIEHFIHKSVQEGLVKVQIVHGKGNHSTEKPVLPEVVRTYLEKNPQCGEFGYAHGNEGGSGAVWVLLRQRSR